MVNEAHPNEWILLCVMNKIPTEIERFISDVFQVIEIRQRVGNVRGILFEVRTNEGNHSIPDDEKFRQVIAYFQWFSAFLFATLR